MNLFCSYIVWTDPRLPPPFLESQTLSSWRRITGHFQGEPEMGPMISQLSGCWINMEELVSSLVSVLTSSSTVKQKLLIKVPGPLLMKQGHHYSLLQTAFPAEADDRNRRSREWEQRSRWGSAGGGSKLHPEVEFALQLRSPVATASIFLPQGLCGSSQFLGTCN